LAGSGDLSASDDDDDRPLAAPRRMLVFDDDFGSTDKSDYFPADLIDGAVQQLSGLSLSSSLSPGVGSDGADPTSPPRGEHSDCSPPSADAASPPPPTAASTLSTVLRATQSVLLAAAGPVLAGFSHRGVKGTGVERLVIDSLRANVATSVVGVGSGELLSSSDRHQLDVVLYDQRLPRLCPGGDGAGGDSLFLPGTVVAVLEIKTRLTSQELTVAIHAADSLPADVPYYVLAFDCPLTLSRVAQEMSGQATATSLVWLC
jgi:hypothetical protein